MGLYPKQFILTKSSFALPNWQFKKVDDFNLNIHPAQQYTFSKIGETELHLIGNVYDWVIPFQTNQQLLDKLAETNSFEEFLEQLAHFTGQFAIIYKNSNDLIVLNDASGQYEIYYDTSFTAFASQPKLICSVLEPKSHTNNNLNNFFNSNQFTSKGIFFGEVTHLANIKHLTPNHHIIINKGIVKRHYPTTPIKPLLVDEAAGRACIMLKGYLKAIAHRYRIAMAVTGGYDSRVLFLASLDLPCDYYVQQHNGMSNEHYDIAIPKELTKRFGKDISIMPDAQNHSDIYTENYYQSIDFPRKILLPSKLLTDHVYINGNVSEIARNYFGYHKSINAKNLAYLNGFKHNIFAIAEYERWLKANRLIFAETGYNLLDMFYWEEKMGNWMAKVKTEASALGQNFTSPFNSTELLTILLSTRREHRDSHNNRLYNRIIEFLEPKATDIPINPCRKQKTIAFMKKMHIYNIYRNLGVKFEFLGL